STRSPGAPRRSPARSPIRPAFRSRAAATPWRRSPSSASPTGSTTSRPAAARSWSSSKARRCRRWRPSKPGPDRRGVSPARRPGQGATAPAILCCTIGEPALPGGCDNDGRQTTMTFARATKIVATLGPASTAPDTLRRLILAGVNVVRVNFSHGSAEEHIRTVELVRQISEEVRRDVGVLADLQGPKIRIGKFENDRITLAEGDRFAFDTDCELGDQQHVGLDYKELVNDVKPGDTLLLNDGRVTMAVEKVTDTRIECIVL